MTPLHIRRRLRTWLMLMVALAVAPSIVLIFVHGFKTTEYVKTDATSKALLLAQQVANTQDNIIDSARQLLMVLAVTTPVLQLDVEGCSDLFVSLRDKFGSLYSNFLLVDPKGKTLAHAFPQNPLPNLSDRQWFQNVMRTKDFSLGGYQIGRGSKIPTMAMGYPILNADGSVRAVLALGVSLKWLGKNLENATLPLDSSVTILDHKGIVLAHEPPAPEMLGTSLANTDIFKTIQTQKKGGTETIGVQDTHSFVGFLPLMQELQNSPFILVGIPSQFAYDPAKQELRAHLLWLAVVAVVGIVLAWNLGNHFLLKPFRHIIEAIEKIGAGNKGVHLENSFAIVELATLGDAFNRMADDLEQNEIRLALQSENLQRSNQELEHFAYMASHDLQEPLRKVTSFAELLAKRYDGQLDETATRYIHFMVDGAQRMHALINHLLAYSRVNTTSREFEDVDCDGLLTSVLDDLQVTIQEADAVITREPLPIVRGDAIQLRQVLQNLVANALKFHGQAPITIHIGAVRSESGWEFFVQDNGIGIEPEQSERIFRMFQRLHAPGEYAGEGIGLAMCKRIVQRHGGHIWVESTPGQGATFRFVLSENKGEGQ